jgi:hypothetical protein
MGFAEGPRAADGAISAKFLLSYRLHRSGGATVTENALHRADGPVRELRSCFGLTPALPDLDLDFIGRDVRQLLKDRLCWDSIDRTAVVDVVMGHLSRSAPGLRGA